ncbi:MAG: ATP-binding protein, partial [Anaerolineaceae bacterium]|nr:ATP-binding protein [Anaerolineaceae bacterium]
MKLIKAKVNLYWNIVDSNNVDIDDNVTCFVGKNESGKTAFLKALYQLNPVHNPPFKADLTNDYPRWRLSYDKKTNPKIDETCYCEVIFCLSESDKNSLQTYFSDHFQIDFPINTTLKAYKHYDGKLILQFEFIEKEIITALLFASNTPMQEREEIENISIEQLENKIDEKIKFYKEEKVILRQYKDLKEKFDTIRNIIFNPLPQDLNAILFELMPKFFYFSEYSLLKGRIDLTTLMNIGSKQLSESEQTAQSLLNLANTTSIDISSNDFEKRVAELEAAANLISREIFSYWTTNEDLSVNLVPDPEIKFGSNGETIVHRYIDIRLNDLRH